jgi:hypothetical protein
VDVYVTLFLHAFFDKTSVLGLVRGMCALVRVIWQQVWGNEKIAELLWFYLYIIASLGRMVLRCIKHPVTGNHTVLERMHSIFNIMS